MPWVWLVLRSASHACATCVTLQTFADYDINDEPDYIF